MRLSCLWVDQLFKLQVCINLTNNSYFIEPDLIEYFKQFGIVADAIVMRDRVTQRGRGFGFVKMQFENKEKAQDGKQKILETNAGKGHFINEKKVDVKSADDY